MAIAKPKRKRRSKIRQTDPKQSARFVEAAKELGLTDGAEFVRVMDTLAPKKPKAK